MEAVTKFEIVLDISDRTVLYDYVEGRTYHRPDIGKWDPTLFWNKGSLKTIGQEDENGERRVKLLDRAISDKRWLEKKSPKDDASVMKAKVSDGSYLSFDYFGADDQITDAYNIPARIIPFYKGGDIVRGRVELELSQPLDADRVIVGLKGWAFVSVRVYNGKTCYDVVKTEEFVNDKSLVWLNEKCADETLDGKYNLLTSDSVPKNTRLSPGKHVFNFEFFIPRDAPQSAPPMVISCCNQGYLMYRVKAAIDKGKVAARGNIVTHKGLWVEKDVDIARDPGSMQPTDVEEVLESFFGSGKVVARARVMRSAFVRGETIPVTLEIQNQNRAEITGVYACIRLYGKARAGTGRLSPSASINIKSEQVGEAGVPADGTAVYKISLPWNFFGSCADGTLLPVGDLQDCALLDVNYEIRVKIKRKGVHRNMELAIPINVGNINSKID